MRLNRVNKIIQRAYGSRYNLPPPEIATRSQYYLYKVQNALSLIKKRKTLTTLLIATIFVASIYYYNMLVTLHQDVLAANAKVDALMQRRNDISINLSKAVLDYSHHERSVFTAVVSLRTLLSENGIKDSDLKAIAKKWEQSVGLAKGTKAGANPNPLTSLGGLLAVAEQYPDLKLSNNFQSMMTALTDVEKDLAGERSNFNDSVNLYTTSLNKFPTKIYAKIFGFEKWPYFEATDEAKRFKPIDY